MNTGRRLALCLRDFHWYAEHWEQAAFSRLVNASVNPKLSEVHKQEQEKLWQTMETLRKVYEEQVQRVKEGKPYDLAAFRL
jgi:hypothetical protein